MFRPPPPKNLFLCQFLRRRLTMNDHPPARAYYSVCSLGRCVNYRTPRRSTPSSSRETLASGHSETPWPGWSCLDWRAAVAGAAQRPDPQQEIGLGMTSTNHSGRRTFLGIVLRTNRRHRPRRHIYLFFLPRFARCVFATTTAVAVAVPVIVGKFFFMHHIYVCV